MRFKLVGAAFLICTFASAEDKLDRLNVVALDPEGQPVMGLQSTDFQLLKDGKPQRIAFSRFTGGKPLQATRPRPNEYSNRSTGLPATVVLIDLLSDRLMSASIINQDITRALRNLESSEGLYLYILTSRGDLYPVHPLPKADTEVTPAEEPWTRNIAPMLQTALKDVFGFRPVDDRDIVIRFDSTAKALRALGAQMRLISGRKNLIWVTHGIPLFGPSISEQGQVDLTIPVRLLCEQLERAQIVVYPVEQSMRGAAAAVGTESNQTLGEFASLTGGRLYRSGGVGEAIQHAMTDSRANYQVAYYAASQDPDGKHRKLRVSCARKDVRLQAEEGFYAVLPPIRPGDLERANLEIAAHSPFDATEIGLRASVSSDPESKRNVRLDIRIDPSDLLLRQAQDRRTGKIALLFAVYAAKGFEQSSPPIPRDVNLTPEQYETATRDGIAFRQAIATGETIRRVRVIVIDRELGTVGSVTVPVQR